MSEARKPPDGTTENPARTLSVWARYGKMMGEIAVWNAYRRPRRGNQKAAIEVGSKLVSEVVGATESTRLDQPVDCARREDDIRTRRHAQGVVFPHSDIKKPPSVLTPTAAT